MDFKRIRRRIRWPFAYILARSLWSLVQVTPLSLVRRLATALGSLLFHVPSCRRLTLANLQLALPGKNRKDHCQIGRQSLVHLIYVYLEFIWHLKHLDRLMATTHFTKESIELLDSVIANKQPAIFCSPHIGSWERGFIALNQQGYTAAAVARKLPNPFLERFFISQRKLTGGDVIHEKGAVRGMLKALKARVPVFLLVDQNTKPHQGGMMVNFFGVPASMSRAPGMMLRRTGAGLYFSSCIRLPDDSFQITLEELVPPGEHTITDEEAGRLLNARTEALVHQHPEQYIWLYERWRYIPPDFNGDRSLFPDYAEPYRADR